ncbi:MULTISPECIES: phenylacetate--CoA ligase family protein [unclassified Geodermatophilus]
MLQDRRTALAARAFRAKAATVRRRNDSFFRELMGQQTMAPEALRDLQWRGATRMLQWATEGTAFYPDFYARHAVEVPAVRSWDDWEALPIIDRSVVKEHASGFLSSEARPGTVREALTGGSTGQPLQTKQDARVPSLALAWRMYSWWGIQPWDDLARVGRWGFGRMETLKNDLQWWPTRQSYLDAALLSPASMRRFHRRIRASRPALLEGYVGSMLEFADFLEESGLDTPSLRAVATTAAPLTTSARHRLESFFGVPVYDEYRGSEFGWLAGECRERNGLHLFADVRLVEVVDERGRPVPAGEVGDLVVTDLTNRVFPLIRYRIGDRGALLGESCPCGVTLPLMSQPEGRSTDILRLPSGRAIGHRLMAMFSRHPDSVRLFQIHQRADYSIVVRVVLGAGHDSTSHVEAAVETLRQRIGNEVPVTTEYVDRLPFTGGKVKYVISDLVPTPPGTTEDPVAPATAR